ncbi:Glycosyltransferase involved in cell wall bisynthesis [Alcanivorax sp. DSM 26293]|uniref:glycosyltransferase family 2 protein n=1 Tax=Alcanivorax sp. DSM 26293 TaxID=1798238 RepID=UPI0008A0781B|nr:glycosyltransferase family A protein [Alcanivorax sp. DSM 26293]SEF40141.1 Glycosyltransferase involved in cell wall bisynthesis [Alcanivorax sp. DSM 26293]
MSKKHSSSLDGVSVIITTYNDACYLPKALDSIGRQKLIPTEVIVVDDGSEDDFASEFVSGKSYPFAVSSYKKENGGASEARNYGLAKASGEFVAFLDVDDFWLEDNLLYKYRKLKKKTQEYFGCYGGYVSEPGGFRSNFKDCKAQVVPDDIGKVNGFPGGAPMYLFRRNLLVEIGGFDITLKQNEDFDLVLRLIHAGYNVAGDNFIGYVRNLRSGSLTRGGNYKSAYQNVSNFLDKAEAGKYFSSEEVSNRRALNALSCWKKCFLKFEEFSFQKLLLDEALRNPEIIGMKYLPLKMYRILLAAFL